MSPLLRQLSRGLVAAGLYFAAAVLSLPLSVPGSIISPLWPPAAVGLYLCLRWGSRMAAAIWIGAWLAFLSRGWDPLSAAITGAAAGLAAWTVCVPLERLQHRGEDFIYTGHLFRFLLLALLSGVISAPLALGGAMLGQRIGPEPLLGWLTWALGTATGTVIVTPLLRAWRLPQGIQWTREKVAEALMFVALLLAVSYVAFDEHRGAWPFAYLPIPFVIWAAYRFNLPAVAWSTATICLVAAWHTVRGEGPFASTDLNTSLLLLVIYISVIGVIGLTLASLIYQRSEAEARLQDERDNLEQRVLARTDALNAELQERARVERQLAEAQRLAQIGSWNWDLQQKEIHWSDQLYRIYGVDREHFEVTPQNFFPMVHPDDRELVQQTFLDCRNSGAPFSIEHRILLPDGTTRTVSARGRGIKEANQRVTRLFGTVQDITDVRRAQAALHEAQERYRLVVELSPEAILVQQHTIVFANPAALLLLGAQAPEQVIGKTIFDFLHPDYHRASKERIARLRNGEHVAPAEKKLVRVDGSVTDVEISSSPFLHQADFALLYIMRDITERKRSAEQMAYLAHFDSLTGLPNRALFNERLEHALTIAARPGRSLEVLFLDLDRFKQINDTRGHAVGDLVLKETAARLQASLRESDTVARLAGDEFVVLIENVDEPQRGGTIAEKILSAFAPPFLTDSSPLQVGSSIGIATYPHDGTDAETLLKLADMAMYRAKQQGRNSYCYYAPELNLQTAERRALEQALRRAVDRSELAVHYQPRIDLASGQVLGMEALLRWNHPELGAIPPREFIPMAEESGLMTTIGYWALQHACQQTREWQEGGSGGLKVAVNLSPRQLSAPGLVEKIGSILAESGLAARDLEIEITEEAIMSDPVKTLHVLNMLCEAGISVTIDDFGAGYSSLAHLKQCPIKAVKIDRSFVLGIPFNHADAAVTRAIISLAHSLDCSVVAQGAETQQQADFLRKHACDSVQGYFFGKPMPAAHFSDLVRTQLPH